MNLKISSNGTLIFEIGKLLVRFFGTPDNYTWCTCFGRTEILWSDWFSLDIESCTENYHSTAFDFQVRARGNLWFCFGNLKAQFYSNRYKHRPFGQTKIEWSNWLSILIIPSMSNRRDD
ncbi:hypothetical protein BDGGKGIB_02744 [Nodularia sphaerocarpa UHCC 0038]|nr:hypothetical protein BDGGKGIB_02744 [Nodularia sphaerocarpa UHCC 0038]